MTKPLDASDYLDDPEKAIALLNAVMASGQSLAVIEQARAHRRTGAGEGGISEAGRAREG